MALNISLLSVLSLLCTCVYLIHSATTTLSTDCGSLIISCNEPDISKCCQGACCSLLSQFQDPITREDEAESIISPNYNYIPPINTPNAIPKIGEACTSRYSKDDRCLGDNTKCMFNDYDSNGYLLGQCCVENNMDGCTKDADCCRVDGICSDNECVRNLPSIIDTNVVQNGIPILVDDGAQNGIETADETEVKDQVVIAEVNNDASDVVQPQSARSNVEYIHEDLHERDRSKPNYELWLSVTANMVAFIVILLGTLCGLNCWLYNNYSVFDIGKKTMSSNHISMQQNTEEKRECDMDESDSTDFEDETDDVFSAKDMNIYQ